MMSAASHRFNMPDKSASKASIAGWILYSRAHSTRTSAIDVRELVSMAIDRTSRIGFVV